MNKFVTEMETDDYGLSDTGSDYAKIFTTYTNINGSNQFNDVQIMFRVLHLSSSMGLGKPKDFVMSFNRDGASDLIKFRDLNTEEYNLSVVYTVDANGKVDVYAKGYLTGAKIKIQVLYCTAISLFIFYNNAVFTATPTNTVEPIQYITDGVTKYSSDFFNISEVAPWSQAPINSGTYTWGDGTAKHPGIAIHQSSTSANSGNRIRVAPNSIVLSGGEKTTVIFKTATTLTGVTRRMGFHNATDNTAPTDGCYCRVIDGSLTGATVNNNTATITGTSYSLSADTWYRIVIQLNPDATLATLTLYADDSITVLWKDTISTNIPTSRTTGHGDVCTYSGTTAINIGYLDYMDVWLPKARRTV